MYEVSLDYSNFLPSIWPPAWLASRALKAIRRAGVESVYTKNAKDILNTRRIFICKDRPKIWKIWGGDKLIRVRLAG